jgi:hypothetical protein
MDININEILELFKMQTDVLVKAIKREEEAIKAIEVVKTSAPTKSVEPTNSSTEVSRFRFAEARRMLDYAFDDRAKPFKEGRWTAVKIGRHNTITEDEFRSETGLTGPIDTNKVYFYSCSTIADKLGMLSSKKQREELRYSLQSMVKKGTIDGRMIGGKWRYSAKDVEPLVTAAKEADARSNVLTLDNFRTAAKEIK